MIYSYDNQLKAVQPYTQYNSDLRKVAVCGEIELFSNEERNIPMILRATIVRTQHSRASQLIMKVNNNIVEIAKKEGFLKLSKTEILALKNVKNEKKSSGVLMRRFSDFVLRDYITGSGPKNVYLKSKRGE